MTDYFENLGDFLRLVALAGVVAPFGMWLLSEGFWKLYKRSSPLVVVRAALVSKRLEVKTKDSNKKAYTVYYMTFQLTDGERCEYETPATAYAMCVLGDTGTLSVRGGRFEDFSGL